MMNKKTNITQVPWGKSPKVPWGKPKKFDIPHITKQDLIMQTSSSSILYASDFEEFFYEDTDFPVPEGEAVGLDVDVGDAVDFVLFSNDYWAPPWDIED